MKITNNTGIALPLAVWLMHDEYDYVDQENYISVTGLMKPIRHIILPKRVPAHLIEADVEDYVARAMGHSLHDSIEKAWTVGHKIAMRKLGYPEDVINRVLINPSDEQRLAVKDSVPVYLEQRAMAQHKVRGITYTIGGKYDMVADGIVQDNKSTSVNTVMFGGRDADYQLQMSLYRWLDHKRVQMGHLPRITEDFGRINFVFTDWSKAMARTSNRYPKSRVDEKEIWLMPLEETEEWVNQKLIMIEHFRNTPEENLPECTEEELWISDPKHKYFSDPAKANDPTARSTKNFDDLGDAHRHLAEKGKGVVKTIPGEPKRCGYCPGMLACTQKNKYFPQGLPQ